MKEVVPIIWQKSKTSIDELVQIFLQKHIAVNLQKLQYVHNDYVRLYKEVEQIANLMGERQLLVELHFIGPLFPLEVHEKYHDVSKEIANLSVDFFKDAKIFLNDFTEFYICEIPAKDRRGITSKSFGSCINSIAKVSENHEATINKMLSIFTMQGKWIDSTICNYRDKFIEHSKSLTSPELSTSPNGNIILLHMKSHYLTYPRTALEEEEAKHQFLTAQDMVCVDSASGKYCYLHVMPYHSLSTTISKGDFLGSCSDSTGYHFKKYGKHMHCFSPSTAVTTPQDIIDSTILGESPELFLSFERISNFFLSGLKYLQQYKTNP